MIRYAWNILINSKKFRVVSPYYTSKLMTYKEASFMAKVTPRAKVIFVR